ncbi:MAG: AAA family ATPase [Lachnospiraceae bacterium]
MLLKQCYIGSFGKLQDVTFDFTEGLTVICKENGWGKSTFAAFVRAMLYGMPSAGSRTKLEDAERRKYKPWQGGKMCGYLIFEANGKEYRAERTFGAKEADDTFRLVDLATNLESGDFSSELGKELFGLDKEAYSRSTYLPQNKISGSGMNDSIGRKLGRIAEGDEESGNFDKAYQKLDELRKKYIPDRQKDEKGYVAELNRSISDAEAHLENCRRKEENAKPWREKERKLAAEKRECGKALTECRSRLEAAAGYEALLAKKRHYGELCQREERLRQQQEGIKSLFRAEMPELEVLQQCRRDAEEAAALSGELRSYRMEERERTRLTALREAFPYGAPQTEEVQECLQREKENKEQSAKAKALCGQAKQEEQSAGKARKVCMLWAVVLFLTAAVLGIGAVVSASGAAGGHGLTETAVSGAQENTGTDGQKRGMPKLPLCFALGAALTAAGGGFALAAAARRKKKQYEAAEQKREALFE